MKLKDIEVGQKVIVIKDCSENNPYRSRRGTVASEPYRESKYTWRIDIELDDGKIVSAVGNHIQLLGSEQND